MRRGRVEHIPATGQVVAAEMRDALGERRRCEDLRAGVRAGYRSSASPARVDAVLLERPERQAERPRRALGGIAAPSRVAAMRAASRCPDARGPGRGCTPAATRARSNAFWLVAPASRWASGTELRRTASIEWRRSLGVTASPTCQRARCHRTTGTAVSAARRRGRARPPHAPDRGAGHGSPRRSVLRRGRLLGPSPSSIASAMPNAGSHPATTSGRNCAANSRSSPPSWPRPVVPSSRP